ncbi:copper transpport protein [Lithohypha guttulata]|uniref:copper transpport protein n=1 Tax=Lithohypha guttulata TaxID=1690604 RepID=UPI002DE10696|nr:copper transpport protein [Lithohypha guttulata]
MDHSHMDHGGMDHGGMGHGDMDMGGQCSMNMIFTWDSNNLCIIFKQWRITSTMSLLMSLLAIVVLTAGYECLRSASRRYEQSYDARMSAFSSSGTSKYSNLASSPITEIVKARQIEKLQRAHG